MELIKSDGSSSTSHFDQKINKSDQKQEFNNISHSNVTVDLDNKTPLNLLSLTSK
jgi:hypothetical protein